MARISSATTTVVNAYFTEKGRAYLLGFEQSGLPLRFGPGGEDYLKIEHFTLYDSDINYESFEKLESGDVPDMSGTGTNMCLKTFGNSAFDTKKRLYY